MTPLCRYCKRSMQLNTAATTAGDTVKQYTCGCQGFIYFVNVPAWKPPLELRSRRR
jgi:hypothetical protein